MISDELANAYDYYLKPESSDPDEQWKKQGLVDSIAAAELIK